MKLKGEVTHYLAVDALNKRQIVINNILALFRFHHTICCDIVFKTLYKLDGWEISNKGTKQTLLRKVIPCQVTYTVYCMYY